MWTSNKTTSCDALNNFKETRPCCVIFHKSLLICIPALIFLLSCCTSRGWKQIFSFFFLLKSASSSHLKRDWMAWSESRTKAGVEIWFFVSSCLFAFGRSQPTSVTGMVIQLQRSQKIESWSLLTWILPVCIHLNKLFFFNLCNAAFFFLFSHMKQLNLDFKSYF